MVEKLKVSGRQGKGARAIWTVDFVFRACCNSHGKMPDLLNNFSPFMVELALNIVCLRRVRTVTVFVDPRAYASELLI